MGNTRNTGYLQNIVQYDANNNIILPSLTGTGTRMVVSSSTGLLSTQAIPTLSDLSGVPTSRTLTINGVTYDLTANRTWSALPTGGIAGDILAKVDGTDYNATWIPNYTSQVQHYVKLGATMTAGTAVYVSGSTGGSGTNMIVSKASNASEATSSKTLGLLKTGGITNDEVFVVTEGLLAGLDTSTANAGDPVWLGVNGALIFGLLNKPTAPAHLVFIGVVTRVQSNNGEIFVKVQNGFELDELHNLSVASPSDGDMIKYVASTGLWTKIAASTTNIVEGTNLYYTQGRFDTAFAAKSTTNLTEGTNLYYTTARVNSDFDTRLATKSTTNLAEGTNLYYTDARVGTYLTNNSYATQTYVNTAVSNLVDAAPSTLDTLNELAAALGDDPNFATTVATSIGTKQAQLNGTGFVKVSGTTVSYDNSTYYLASNPSGYITGISFANVSAKPTTIAGYGITDSLVYTTSTYSNPSWITTLAWSKITGAPAFITSYTETDTLATVTGRGASTSTAITLLSNLTLSNANSTADLGGVLIVRGNGSVYNTHYLTTGVANVAQYYQYNASGTLINLINAGGNSYITGGSLGLGTSFSGINTSSLLTIKATETDGNQIYIVQSNDDRGWRFKAKTDGHFYLQSAYTATNIDRLKIEFDTGATTFTATSTNGITIITNDVTTLKMRSSTGGSKSWGFATTNLIGSDFGIYQSNSNGGDPISAGSAKLYFNGTDNVVINHGGPYSLGANFRYGGTYISEFHLGRTNSGADSKASIIYDIEGAEIFELRRNYTAAVFKITMGSTAHLTISNTGAATFNSSITVGTISGLVSSVFGYSSSYPTLIVGPTGNNTYKTLCFGVDVSGNPSGAFSGTGSEYVWRNTATFITPNSSNNGFNTLLSWNSSGQITILGATTVGSLTSNGDITANGGGSTAVTVYNSSSIRAKLSMTGNEGDLTLYGSSATAKVYLSAYYDSYFNSGKVGIGLSNPQAILDVSHTAGTTNIIRVSNGSGSYRWRVDQNFAMIMTNASGTDTFSVSTSGSISTPAQFTSFSTAPFSLQSSGNTATYTQTTIYANQNNTSGSTANGLFIERGKLTDSGSAETRYLVIGARGGSIQWMVDGSGYTTQYAAAEVKPTGDGNIFVGRYSGGSATVFRVYQASADGYLELSTGANQVVTKLSGYTGTAGYTLSNFGVGTTSPSLKFVVDGGGTTGAAVRFEKQASQGDGMIAYFVNSSNGGYSSYIYIGSNPGTDWKIGKNISNPTQTTYHFEIVDSSNNVRLQINNSTGNATFSSDVIAYSDARLKKNIRPIENALLKVLASTGILYDRVDTTEINTFGFIAQDLEKIIPEVVTTNDIGIKGVKYQNMVALLTEAIKEQQGQIESQKSEIEELKDLVKQLINR